MGSHCVDLLRGAWLGFLTEGVRQVGEAASMKREFVSVLLCALAAIAPVGAGQKTREAKVREKLALMPAGATVEVRQEDAKWKGRLGELGTESFVVQVATTSRIEQRSIRYDQVRGVKNLSHGGGIGTGTKVALGVVVGVGVSALVALLYFGAVGWL